MFLHTIHKLKDEKKFDVDIHDDYEFNSLKSLTTV